MAPTDLNIVKISSLGKNAFPKISGKRYDFMAGLRRLESTTGLPPVLDVEGTIKLHGMHADIVFDLNDYITRMANPEAAAEDLAAMAAAIDLSRGAAQTEVSSSPLKVTFQSRNRICDPNSSQNGWPRDIAKFSDALVYIRDRVLTCYARKNPDRPLDRAYPLIIAGEWIGPNVQKDVGVSRLSARLVIISIQINGIWQKDLDYSEVEATRANIYSIFRSGQQVLKLDTSDLSEFNQTLIQMQKIADAVEECCPFSVAFGVNNERGEGVVWKPGVPEGRADASYWMKTKGPSHHPGSRTHADKMQDEETRKKTVDELGQRFVSPRRIEQGFEYLVEMGNEPSRVSVRIFIDWVVKDIWLEEKREIAELEKEKKGAESSLKKKVKWLARCAFVQQMGQCGVSIAQLV